MPENSVLHLAGSNTARSWNFFTLPKTVECYSNDGAMGIDGQVSSLIGESLASPNRVHIGIVGDLTFFYDMNSLGNKHIGKNFRLMIINNGKGAEFRLYSHPAAAFGDDADKYMAAAGHYGNKSPNLVRHYVEDLGYEYLSASSKAEYQEKVERFLETDITDKPIVFEIFTDSNDESNAIYMMNHIVQNSQAVVENMAKDVIRSIAGEKGINKIKKIVRKSK